jgi:hypothetical protein
MDLMEIELESADWIHLDQNRDWQKALVNMVMNILLLPLALQSFMELGLTLHLLKHYQATLMNFHIP